MDDPEHEYEVRLEGLVEGTFFEREPAVEFYEHVAKEHPTEFVELIDVRRKVLKRQNADE